VLLASGALVIRTVLRAGIETVFLIVTVTVVAAVLPFSKALVVEVALEIECVFSRVTVTVGAGGQSNGVVATSAASTKTAII